MDIMARGMARKAQQTIDNAIVDGDALGFTQYQTFYLDADNGDDENDGLSSGTAWQSFDHALSYIASIKWRELSGYPTLTLANGNYTSNFSDSEGIPHLIGCNGIFIQSTSNNPANVTLTMSGSLKIAGIRQYYFYAMSLVATNVYINSKCALYCDLCNFTLSSGTLFQSDGALISITSNTTINVPSSATALFFCQNGGNMLIGGGTITISGSLTVSAATVWVRRNSFIDFSVGGTATFSGSITGKRFQATAFGKIFTNFSGLNFIPGNSAGTLDLSSRYDDVIAALPSSAGTSGSLYKSGTDVQQA